MKIAIKAELEADMVITAPVIAKLYPYEFEVYKENGLWNALRVYGLGFRDD